MTFQQKYLSILNVVQEEIQQVLNNLTDGVDVREPLKSKLYGFLNAPAKHIRPLVSFLYLKATGGDIDEKQILFQSAIELIHNASLIHDDVIDESIVRRGEKSVNADFGNKMAVISGDYILSCALDKVIKIGLIELIQMLSDTLAVMSKGEINQHFSRFEIPKIEDYIEKSVQKTAKLFETAVCGSLLIANSNVNGHNFAENFGLAFQIRDDLINCKTTQSDIKDGIYTAPVIFAGDKNKFENGVEKTQILLNNYVDEAVKELLYFEESKYKTALEELLELLKNG